MEKAILRGEMYYADLSPVVGSEQGGVRPVLIIQNNIGNNYSPTIIVAAITGKAKSELPTHISLAGMPSLQRDSIVLLEQIRTIDKRRLKNYIGTLDEVLMNEVNRALTVSIGLHDTIHQHLIMSLCSTCVQQFYDSPVHTIKRVNPKQKIKEPCMFCNVRQGYDFEIKTSRR